MTPPPRCAGCGKTPAELPEYTAAALVEGMTPDEYVVEEEGTLNKDTGRFLCTACYVDCGMPTGARGWTA